MPQNENIYPIFDRLLSRREREQMLGQRGAMIWLTGLSGSGKSTLAVALERELYRRGNLCRVLDGDNIRTGINNNLLARSTSVFRLRTAGKTSAALQKSPSFSWIPASSP